VRDRIKTITAPRHRLPGPIGPIVAQVNQGLRDCGAYFRVGSSTRKFQGLDHSEGQAKFLAKKNGRDAAGQLHCTVLCRAGVYQLNGTRQVVHDSDVVKDLGTPDPRERHARLDGRETGNGARSRDRRTCSFDALGSVDPLATAPAPSLRTLEQALDTSACTIQYLA
jgi:hypothetical protein